MLNTLGAGFLVVNVSLQRSVGISASQGFRVDVFLQSLLRSFGACLFVVDVAVYALHGLIELRMQHHVGLVLDVGR